jgi:pimeloyl-ACP methyl ester carboxylesterase
MQLLSRGVDVGLAPLGALLPEGESTPARDTFLAAVNGVYGDYLVRTGNPLALEMILRDAGQPLKLDDPSDMSAGSRGGRAGDRLLILVHGLCMNDRQWTRAGHDHGAALARDLGFTPLYLRYNSGLRVADNGRAFAELLENLVARWPQRVQELVVIGHSMGGLVARSACHHGREADHGWLQRLRRLVFLGTPHHGAPLERGGHWLDILLGLSPYSAPIARLGKARSAGITDLRHGSVTNHRREFVPLPEGVKCYAAAATLGARRGGLSERLVGDGLVPLNSALGLHANAARSLAIPKAHQWVGHDMGHLELLHRPEVYRQLSAWLSTAD